MFLLLPLVMTASSIADAHRPLATRTLACEVPGSIPARSMVPPLWLASTQPVSSWSVAEPTVESRPLELWRAPDGLFYVNGLINGQPIRFVVDTGASMVVLTASDARRSNVIAAGEAVQLEAETAAGRSTLTRVTLASLQVGGTGVTAAPAAVAREGLNVSLLGQSWLSHLASVTIEGDRMTLR